MRITIEILGDTVLDRELLRFTERLGDLTPAFEAIADDFLAIEERQFASEGGGNWRPLAASTLERKARLGLDHRILHATHRLRNSLTQKGNAEAIRRITADEALLGTSVPYAFFHQQGAGVPRRRPVELSEADKRRWVRSIQSWLVGGGGRGL